MAEKSNRISIQESFPLPGYTLYGDKMPKEITLRAMTTVEEKLRLAGTGYDVIPQLIQACCLDEDVDMYELKLFDIQYLMYKLRIVTYGSDYHVKMICPTCGKEMDIHVDLDKLEIKQLPDDFVEPFEIGPLPVSGDVLTCKIPTIKEYLDIMKEGKRILSKNPNYVGDPTFILNYQSEIVEINGERKEPYKIRQYVEQMHAKDLRYFDSKYEPMQSLYGLDTVVFETCPHCNNEVVFDLPVNEEFFRPVY